MRKIHYECTDGIGVLTLNDPDRLNAMSEEMAEEFHALTRELSQDASLRVLILTGRGRAFSAGGDIGMLVRKTQQNADVNRREMKAFYNSFLGIRQLAVPLIAALNGPAIGAGLGLACACDWRLACEGATFAANFVHLGLHPGMGTSYFLPHILGLAKALPLLVSGRALGTEEALALGLLHEVMGEESFHRRPMELAQQLSVLPQSGVQDVLRTLRTTSVDLDRALEQEAVRQADNFGDSACRAAIQALANKLGVLRS